MNSLRKCAECIGAKKTEHRVTRVEDYRASHGYLWAFHECAAGHVTAHYVTPQEYKKLKAELEVLGR